MGLGISLNTNNYPTCMHRGKVIGSVVIVVVVDTESAKSGNLGT